MLMLGRGVIVGVLILISTSSFAQKYTRPSGERLKVGGQFGATSFQGDLGSRNFRNPVEYDFDARYGTKPGLGLVANYTFQNIFGLRMSFLYSDIAGVRDENWGKYSFESTINDIDVGGTISAYDLFQLSRYQYTKGLKWLARFDGLYYISVGFSHSNPSFYSQNILINSLEINTFYGCTGVEISLFLNNQTSVSVGSNVRVYTTDRMDGFKSGRDNDAIWYHYFRFSYQLFKK